MSPAGLPWRSTLDAIALEQARTFGEVLPSGQELHQVVAKNQHRLLIREGRQPAFDPSPHRALGDAEKARRFVDSVAAMDLDPMARGLATSGHRQCRPHESSRSTERHSFRAPQQKSLQRFAQDQAASADLDRAKLAGLQQFVEGRTRKARDGRSITNTERNALLRWDVGRFVRP